MSSTQKFVLLAALIFFGSGVIVYVASDKTMRPEIWEWMKTIFDWVIAAGVGGAAAGIWRDQALRTKVVPNLEIMGPQIETLKADVEQIKEKIVV